MKNIDQESIEQIWDDLLSRQADKILLTFSQLSNSDKQYILGHLQRMVTEKGWQAEQRQSARIALKVLKNLSNRNEKK